MSDDNIDSPPTSPGLRALVRLLAIIAVVLIAGALKLSTIVTMPLAFAAFLVAVFWPLQQRFEKRMKRGLAFGLTYLIFTAVIGLFVGSLWLSGELVAAKSDKYEERFAEISQQAKEWLAARGLGSMGAPQGAPQGVEANAALTQVLPQVLPLVTEWSSAFFGELVLIIAFFVLGLLEVHAFRLKLEQGLASDKVARWLESTYAITHDFLQYILVRTVIGLITGVAVWILSWLIGLDFAFVWAFTNFLLSYIPTLGAIIGVVPPVLFAVVQFGFGPETLLTLIGVSAVQIIMGVYIDPLMQGRRLSLSPLVILFSITFWGWIWGIAGAFIAIPITTTIVIATNQFEHTRWIALMLADIRVSGRLENQVVDPRQSES